ncbi:MAG: DJ-1/PfpI family protein [Nitrospinaceae bacterium]
MNRRPDRMGRLAEKNILFIIPKDYYNEEELDTLRPIFEEEGASIRIASGKMKEAVGMKNGRVMPDVLIVDAIEGIVGDSYVTGFRGTRQIKGIFHGVVVIGGRGARSYLWKDRLVRLLLTDRYRSGFVVSAIGLGVPCLGITGLLENQEVAAENDKHVLAELDKANAIISEDQDVVALERVVTGRNASAAEAFAEALIEQVAQTRKS